LRRTYSIWRFFALLAICLAYANSFENGFHFDDFHTVTDNPAVRSLDNLPHFFSDARTFSVLPANQTYRPVVTASLALAYALGHGYVPVWFHLTTFLLFLLLVWLLTDLYGGLMPRWLALGAAAWFGLHPAMAETVNYVIQRGDLYCTLGCVAALVVYARYPLQRRWGWYLLPLAFAMLSKPPAAVFPALLLGYVWFFEAEVSAGNRWRRSLRAAVPSLVVVGALLWLQSAMTPKTFTPSILSPWAYRLVQPYVWLRYCGALFLPVHLNVDSDLGPISDVLDRRALAGLLFLALLGVAIWFSARRRRLYPIAYGLIWFVVTQLPTSLYPLSEVENDHRMFFSFVGLILAVVWAGWLLFECLPASLPRTSWLKPVTLTLVVLLLSGYAYGVHVRNKVWRNEETLWLDDVEKSPRNGRGLMNYGLTQMNKGAYPVALDYFTKALEYTPNYAALEINLGVVNGAMAQQGDAARAAMAEQHFLRAITLAPNDDTTHAFYGRWLKSEGQVVAAAEELKKAIALNPLRPMQRDEMADLYSRMARLDAPRTADDWLNRSLAQYQQAQYEQAIESARSALRIDPHSAEAWNNIAAGYASLHGWDEAIDAAQRAIVLKPDFQLAKNNLAWSMSQKKTAGH
jgi:Flp pilus assembly protein TadD